MPKIKTFLLILIFSLSFHCSNDSGLFFDPTYWSSPYKGITFTDQFANVLKKDESDWCGNKHSSWDGSGISVSMSQYQFLPAYPNPVDQETGNIRLVFFSGVESRIKLFINDGDYKTVIIITDTLYTHGLYEIKWDLKDRLGQKVPGGIYRCYMYAPDFECCGDIWIK
jgi:hypothetical protein